MYQIIEIAPKIKELISTCPFLDEFGIIFDPTSYETYAQDQTMPDQALIGVEYAKITTESVSVHGINTSLVDRVLSWRFIRRPEPDLPNVSNFLTNFIEWLDFMQQSGLTPKFSYKRMIDGSVESVVNSKERMSAANASLIAENEGLSVYNVDIHVQYAIEYQKKERY